MTLHYGVLWQIHKNTAEERDHALEYVRAKHGPDRVTGRVFGHTAELVEVDRSVQPGHWLVELTSTSASVTVAL